MSERRTLLSRPRTRVYDCNYNIGEGYYKPMMDHLDRKYYGTSAAPAAAKPSSGFFDSSPKSLFGTSGSSAFDEYRSSSPVRSRRSGSDSRLSLPDDEFEQEVAAMRRARAAKVSAARTASLEKEFESAFNGFASDGKPRPRLNYTEKMLDTVGLNSKSQGALEDEVYKKRTKSFFQDAEDVVATAELHANNRRSAALKAHLQDQADEQSAGQLAAEARARKSKARLLDIQNELDGIVERDAARQKRSANLKALFADNEALTESVSSFKKKSSKKVSF
ncbi:uncharacterized protein LOC111036222 [Myzus persicae]|uniref:uncharacterized protein LOC111036222 n=1 Tax=Myzus persicae TaxID=13164 RepID=UPI000B930785|nr:uncharacterized protein LOC111036222 [Myzus persicae]XP_022173878.1 uncharacterized protein LOC111036222 [Myzus persicae]